jgi:hypothetical protein
MYIYIFLLSVMESAKDMIVKNDSNGSNNTVTMINEMVNKVINIDIQNSHPNLLDSVCKYVGSVTYLLVKAKGDDSLYYPCLEFLFRVYALAGQRGSGQAGAGLEGAGPAVIEKSAVKAIHQLCIRGRKVYICKYVYIYLNIHMHIYIYVNINIYTHIYIYRYINICFQVCVRVFIL